MSVYRDATACKSKWNQLVPKFKRIANYFSRTGTNSVDYWSMSQDDRKKMGLPKLFSEEIYYGMNEWFQLRPTMQPPHTRDLLSSKDRNHEPSSGSVLVNEVHEVSDDDNKDVMDVANSHDNSTDQTSSAFSLVARAVLFQQTASFPNHDTQVPSVRIGRPKATIPAGVVLQMVSSSNTTENGVYRRPGNTAIRRKTLTTTSLVAEAT